jgi:hypothetical protein
VWQPPERLDHSTPACFDCYAYLFRMAFRQDAHSWPELTMDQGASSGELDSSALHSQQWWG